MAVYVPPLKSLLSALFSSYLFRSVIFTVVIFIAISLDLKCGHDSAYVVL